MADSRAGAQRTEDQRAGGTAPGHQIHKRPAMGHFLGIY